MERLLTTTTTMLNIKRNGQVYPEETPEILQTQLKPEVAYETNVSSRASSTLSVMGGKTGTAGTAAGRTRKEAAPDVPDDPDGGRPDPGAAQYYYRNAHLYITDVHQGEQSTRPAQGHAPGNLTY